MNHLLSFMPGGCQAGSAFRVTASPEPKNPAKKPHERDNDETKFRAGPAGNETDNGRRNGVAESMNEKDVEGKGACPNRGVCNIGEDGVGGSGVEEQAKDGEKHEYPGQAKVSPQKTQDHGKADKHGGYGKQEKGTGKTGPEPKPPQDAREYVHKTGHSQQPPEEGRGVQRT